MPRSRHRHRSAGRGWPGWEFILGVLLVAFAATIPLGSIGFLAARLVAALAWTAGVIGIAWLRPRGGTEERRSWAAAGAVATLAAWCGWQLWPRPEGWLGGIWRGDASLLRQIATDAQGLTIALDPFISLHTLLLWSGLGVLAWACSRQLRGRPAVSMALYGLMGLGLFQSVMGIFFLKDSGERICGTLGSPNALGGLLAMTLPVTLGLVFAISGQRVLRGRTSFRWWFHRLGNDWGAWRGPALWAALGIQWIALHFTGSMGATLAAGAACGVLLVWQAKEHPEIRGRLIAAGTVLAVLAIVFNIYARSRNGLDRAAGDPSAFQQSKASRVEIWRAAARLCWAFPQGTGPGGTALAMPMFQTGVYGRNRLDYAHNDTLQFLGDLGPVGFGALAWLLGLVLWRGGQACRQRIDRESSSAWLWRGAWLAVLAALFHAQMEFNLSARPGIQVVFAILCGILWGSRAHAGGGETAVPVRQGRHLGVPAVALLLLLGGGAVSLSLAAAWAWSLHEGAVAAVGLEPDETLWFRCPVLAPGEALQALSRAARLAPGSALMHWTTAETRLALHRQRVQQAAQSLLPPAGDDQAAETPLDPMLPAHEQELVMAGLALRVEEAEMLRAALDDVNTAVRLAPWDAISRLVRGKILLRCEALKQLGAEEGLHGRRDLEIAVKLYPLDAGVLAEACMALSGGALLPQDVEDLLGWGAQALTLDASLAGTVLDSWWAGQVPLSRILEIPRLPLPVLWRLYALMDKQNRTEAARKCLVALESNLAGVRPPESSLLWTPALWKKWNIQQMQDRIRLASEWLKYYLRAGDWEGVEALANRLAQARHDRFQMELDKLELSGTDSTVLRRLRLREWEADGRLSPEWTMEWGLLELDASMSARQIQDPLAEIILLDGLRPVDQAHLQAHRTGLADAPFLAALLDAKVAEAAGRPDEAAAVLEALLDNGPVPGRFVHRIWLWRAKLLRQAGDAAAAGDALREAAKACPTDPDVAAALVEFGQGGGADGEHGKPDLNLGFMGRRLVLMHACLEPEPGPAKGSDLHLLWRFRGSLPPDLQMDVRILDGNGRRLLRQVATVDQEESAYFNRGNPRVGSTWTWTIPLPPTAVDGHLVEVRLRSAANYLPSDDGLAAVALNLEQLPRVPETNPSPNVESNDPVLDFVSPAR